jgi:integrase/recombinase XerD
MSKALTGFLQYKGAEGVAPTTVEGYKRDLKVWIEYQGDQDILEIESQHILAFLNYMRSDYVPRRITGGNSRKLTPKTIYNIYISVASFFTWASREFNLFNPMKSIPRPRVPDDPPVEPFKKEELELLIKACDFCEEADTDRRRKFTMQRSTAKRDNAILLTLVDTGLRASELCALPIADVDMKRDGRKSGREKRERPRVVKAAWFTWANRRGVFCGATWLSAKMARILMHRSSSENFSGPLRATPCAR